ncbi:TATA-binding protein-associated factor 172-like isoform X2 [Dysidea avara]|uniref:TATA-binding protein-associated factor 172-like isoform X2 n=1 Tax=Dysidea avara TaxID=196820 RepID=UPI00331CE210
MVTDEGDAELAKMSEKERAMFYRQQLKQKLGLVAQGKVFSTGIEKLFDDEDLILKKEEDVALKPSKSEAIPTSSTAIKLAHKGQHAVKELAALNRVSAREKLAAKRRAKQQAKLSAKQKEKNTETVEPPSKKVCLSSPETIGDSEPMTVEEVSVDDSVTEERSDWPFTVFCEELFKDLFDPVWEVRHGVAMALREVIKVHGCTAGISVHTPQIKRVVVNQAWLEDACIRLLCVLALDRFGDFVTDELVAPVRATSAQVLGVLLDHVEATQVQEVVRLLMVLAHQAEWEVRHASLLGIQHMLAVRQVDAATLLPLLMPAILDGLQDQYDDVRAIAAAALLPVARKLPSLLPEKILNVVGILWDNLLDLDELSASTNSVMELLSLLVVELGNNTVVSETQQGMVESLSTLVTRLWPFLGHNICSVRQSCVKTLLALLSGSDNQKSDDAIPWLPDVLQELLCHIFQRMLTEPKEPVRQLLWQVYQVAVTSSTATDLANVSSPWLSTWLQLLIHTPSDQPLPQCLLVASATRRSGSTNKPVGSSSIAGGVIYIGGTVGVESATEKDEAVIKCRVLGSRAVGHLAMSLITSSSSPEAIEVVNNLVQLLIQLLSTNMSVHKMVASLIVSFWTTDTKEVPQSLDEVQAQLSVAILEQPIYSDIIPLLVNLQRECQILSITMQSKGLKPSSDIGIQQQSGAFSVDAAKQLISDDYQQLVSIELSASEQEEFEEKKRNVLAALGQLQDENQKLHTKVHNCIAGAIISLRKLPTKLNPIIRPIMDSIKLELNSTLQQQAGIWLCALLELCKERTPCPNPKIIKNLCQFLCADSSHTPPVVPQALQVKEGVELWTWNIGIITLTNHQSKTSEPHPHRGSRKISQQLKEAVSTAEDKSSTSGDVSQVQRRGAVITVGKLAEHFGSELFSTLPNLWSSIVQSLERLPQSVGDVLSEAVLVNVTSALHALQVLEVVVPVADDNLKPQVLSLLPKLLSCVTSNFTAIRHMAARCISVMANSSVHRVLEFIIKEIVPLMGDASSATNRQGAIETIGCLLEVAGMNVLCYAVLLVMPTLGRMSDQDSHVRLMASHCFANLVTFVTMEAGVESPDEMSQELKERREKERHFLEQLLDTSKLSQYKVPSIVKAELRRYQQDGINWLAFLNQYNLHGILCDDMGLGKTLQAICIVAGDYQTRKEHYKATKNADCKPLPSLVVCPPTLTPHWHYEVNKFINDKHFTTLQYVGGPQERHMLQSKLCKNSLVIASYDIVRNDIDFFSKINWNYCILDEGHVIKNSKTKITKAVKLLRANHRLILSGTPVQNSVLELWSLFDFLLPGFLGTQKQFNERFGKPILLSRYSKSSSKEQEAGVLAMETLHKQVLPFVLRRLKEDVLDDLPPKIIQDYYCNLSPLQVELYEDFSKSQAKKEVDNILMVEEDQPQSKVTSQQTHVFQALQYLRKVCNHPLLVLNQKHPLYTRITDNIDPDSLTDIEHAAKMVALKQLLHECGIGVGHESSGEGDLTGSSAAAAVGQHRVLVFCQLKSMLDLIEVHLFKAQMPTVTYLRLDGSLPLNQRFKTVTRFNNDPSIDVLLLTTQVGGLGLNLTGADTVIFFEHDWNPMKDLQAMDRAHRIGQKKVVNVYRLVTRGTLEEKIMNLQQFKLNIANTVINQDNSSLLSMDTSQMLDLFSLGGMAANPSVGGAGSSDTPSSKDIKPGLKGMLENLTELWDDSRYESELNLSTFMQSLGKQ